MLTDYFTYALVRLLDGVLPGLAPFEFSGNNDVFNPYGTHIFALLVRGFLNG
jgi:hypothetical protein